MNKTVSRITSGLLLLAFFLGGQAYVNRDLVSGRPPAINTVTLDGKTFSLAQLEGKPSLIYFWASWCGICRTMESSMVDLSQNTAMVSVAMQSGGSQAMHDYLAEKNITMPVINDPGGNISAQYGIKGVPAIFVLDEQGNVKYATSGYSPSFAIKARLWLASL